jgi:hypothetical protein
MKSFMKLKSFISLYRYYRGKCPGTLYADPEWTRTRKSAFSKAWDRMGWDEAL